VSIPRLVLDGVEVDSLLAELESRSFDIRELAYQEIKKAIKKSSTRYTAKSAFQTTEAQIARSWLGPPSEVVSDTNHQGDPGDTQRFTDEHGNIESAARSAIEGLTTVMPTVAWTLGAPFRGFIPKSRTYHLALDKIHQQYKAQIVQPWLESLNKEGERTLLGTIGLSSNAARDSLNSALEREQTLYERELKTKRKPVDQKAVENLVAAYVNLLAAEEALQELNRRMGEQ
jgi:hypothetical protein